MEKTFKNNQGVAVVEVILILVDIYTYIFNVFNECNEYKYQTM